MPRYIVSCILALLLFSACVSRAEAGDERVIAQQAPPSEQQRSFVAARLYWAITTYFAHREALPTTFDLDARFRQFLSDSAAARTRLDLDLACMRLLAWLGNGHTWFADERLFDTMIELPFRLRPIDGAWVVIRSRDGSGLAPGDAVDTVDGQPTEAWIDSRLDVVGGSGQADRRILLQARPFLWPYRFRLGLHDGRTVMIDRTIPPAGPWRGRLAGDTVSVSEPRPGVVVISVPGFDEPRYEAAALAAVRAHRDAAAILFDVRGNGGGSTPAALLSALVTTPYRDMIDATPLHIGTLDAWAAAGQPVLADAAIRSGGTLVQPDHPIFHGRVVVLADRSCASACEDFLLALRASRRATIVGETSWGSTGQPFLLDFPELAMKAAIGAKREYFPDGTPFEGVGVVPDVPLPLTVAGLRAGRDDVLERALDLAARKP